MGIPKFSPIWLFLALLSCFFLRFNNAFSNVQVKFQSSKPSISNSNTNKMRRISTTNNMLAVSAGLVNTGRYLLTIPAMYGLMSINEYITHKYYQHAEFNKAPLIKFISRVFFNNKMIKINGGGHVEHHAETLDDMSLRSNDNWKKSPASIMLDKDEFRGTAFTWPVLGMMTIQMIPSTLLVFNHILGFSVLQTMAMLIPAMLLHGTAWNCLHPSMHNLNDVKVNQGPPSKIFASFRDSAYFKYLYQNHEGHHILGGLGNYNVCCPGADHLFGTYVEEKIWRPKVSIKSTPSDTTTGVDNISLLLSEMSSPITPAVSLNYIAATTVSSI